MLAQMALAASALRMPDGSAACVVWRQQVGTFVTMYGQKVHIGIEGQSDYGGILANGRSIQIEGKSPIGRLSPAQERWRAMVIRMGGLYVLARRPGDVTDAVTAELRRAAK